jgi:hypothetical protein
MGHFLSVSTCLLLEKLHVLDLFGVEIGGAIRMSDTEGEMGEAGDIQDDMDAIFGDDKAESEAEGDGSDDGSDEDAGGWPDQETAKLIDLYSSHPELYVVTHKWYAHKDRKAATYLQIATEMGCSGMFVSYCCKCIEHVVVINC